VRPQSVVPRYSLIKPDYTTDWGILQVTTKEYLQQGYRLARGIRFKKERISELRILAERSTSSYQAERVSGTSQRSRLENCVCQIDEWEREIDSDIKKLREIYLCIAKVENPDFRQLLELRYVDGYKWEEIIEKMNYTERHIMRLHGQALLKIKMSVNVS